MTIKCINNKITELPQSLQRFAFTQNEQGIADLSIGKEYIVYGVRENKWGKFYLILTDTVNVDSPWWMPQALFEVVESSMPTTWQRKSHGLFSRAWTFADPSYFDTEQDIEDGTPRGVEVFKNIKQKTP